MRVRVILRIDSDGCRFTRQTLTSADKYCCVAMKVLIADDEPIPRRLVEASLCRAGYSPVVATNGMDVLRILGEPDCPRLVVLDWEMPRLDGLGVSARCGRVARSPTSTLCC